MRRVPRDIRGEDRVDRTHLAGGQRHVDRLDRLPGHRFHRSGGRCGLRLNGSSAAGSANATMTSNADPRRPSALRRESDVEPITGWAFSYPIVHQSLLDVRDPCSPPISGEHGIGDVLHALAITLEGFAGRHHLLAGGEELIGEPRRERAGLAQLLDLGRHLLAVLGHRLPFGRHRHPVAFQIPAH